MIDDKELEELSKELGLEVETETISLAELEKAETAENVKRIVEALENNQKILLQLLNSILQNQKVIVDEISRIEKPTVPPTTVPYPAQPYTPQPTKPYVPDLKHQYTWWVTTSGRTVEYKPKWKALLWAAKAK